MSIPVFNHSRCSEFIYGRITTAKKGAFFGKACLPKRHHCPACATLPCRTGDPVETLRSQRPFSKTDRTIALGFLSAKDHGSVQIFFCRPAVRGWGTYVLRKLSKRAPRRALPSIPNVVLTF